MLGANVKEIDYPKDVGILRSAPDSPAAALGIHWWDKQRVPTGYADPGLPTEVRSAWATMFRQMVFLGEGDDSMSIALCKYAADVNWTEAPVVVLDSEGQLECVAATVSEYIISLSNEPTVLRQWFDEQGMTVETDTSLLRSKVRFLPNPNDRCEALQTGSRNLAPFKMANPLEISDVLGMRGTDFRVAAYLAAIERKERPIEIQCDGDGRVATIFLELASLAVPQKFRGIALGDPISALSALGQPKKPNWKRWDTEEIAMAVDHNSAHVVRITLMLRASLGEHLR